MIVTLESAPTSIGTDREQVLDECDEFSETHESKVVQQLYKMQ
jgi:hypothetical protein